MLPLIFMGVEMLLFDNSVLKMNLLDSQLNFHIKSLTFNYFEYFFILLATTLYQGQLLATTLYQGNHARNAINEL
jgi:hypothetical protein